MKCSFTSSAIFRSAAQSFWLLLGLVDQGPQVTRVCRIADIDHISEMQSPLPDCQAAFFEHEAALQFRCATSVISPRRDGKVRSEVEFD